MELLIIYKIRAPIITKNNNTKNQWWKEDTSLCHKRQHTNTFTSTLQ